MARDYCPLDSISKLVPPRRKTWKNGKRIPAPFRFPFDHFLRTGFRRFVNSAGIAAALLYYKYTHTRTEKNTVRDFLVQLKHRRSNLCHIWVALTLALQTDEIFALFLMKSAISIGPRTRTIVKIFRGNLFIFFWRENCGSEEWQCFEERDAGGNLFTRRSITNLNQFLRRTVIGYSRFRIR